MKSNSIMKITYQIHCSFKRCFLKATQDQKHSTMTLFILLCLSYMERTTKQFCPISGKVSNQHQLHGDKQLGTLTSLGQDWQGRMGSGAMFHLQQEYGTTASTSHANTEPLALVTNSDLFSEASKSSEITGLKKSSLKWSPNKFKNHALDTYSFQNLHKTLGHSNCPDFFPHIVHPPCSCR